MKTRSHEMELRAFLTERFSQDLTSLPLDASLVDELGLDSLAGLELMAEIEDRFRVYFTAEQLSEPRTLRNILQVLDALSWRKAS